MPMTEPESDNDAEIADASDVSMRFDGKRCIHARFRAARRANGVVANVEGRPVGVGSHVHRLQERALSRHPNARAIQWLMCTARPTDSPSTHIARHSTRQTDSGIVQLPAASCRKPTSVGPTAASR